MQLLFSFDQDMKVEKTFIETLASQLSFDQVLILACWAQSTRINGWVILQNEKRKAVEDYQAMKQEREQLSEELARIKREKIEIESNLKMKEGKLETLEKKYKDVMEENLVASNQKDEASKVRII